MQTALHENLQFAADDDKSPAIGRKLCAAVAVVVLSIVIPFLRFRDGSPSALVDFLTGDGLYLLCMMVAVSIAYAFILFEYYSKLKKLHAARQQPLEDAARELARHIYPMALLACISNIVLGLSSFIGQDPLQLRAGQGIGIHCPGGTFCTGTSIVLVLPDVFVPNGMFLYAFWGAFIFNCYQYLNRIVNNDFLPSTWLGGAVRLAAAVLASTLAFVVLFQDTYAWPTNFTGSDLKEAESHHLRAGYAVALAFFTGFFPMATVRVIFRIVTDRISQLTPLFGKYVHTPLTVIDGITSDVQDRLAEAGIDSVQMLSRSTVAELKNPLGKALPYSPEVLSDWIDQAKLALYFTEESELAEVRSIGIRTYSDLKRYQLEALRNPVDFTNIGLKAIPPERLRALVMQGPLP